MATVVFGVAGAVAGGAVGGPKGKQIGWAIGTLIGGALFGPKQKKQARGPSEDIRFSGSQYNVPILQPYGCFRVGGNIIWGRDLVEVATNVRTGGKGLARPTQKKYSYTVDMAVAVCRGPIGDIKRIWAEDRLILDKTVTPALVPTNLTIYKGTRTQPVDSTIEAHEGVGNTPAYRGLAYVVFNDFDLEPYGNRIPALTFEVCPNALLTDLPNLFAWFYAGNITGLSNGDPITLVPDASINDRDAFNTSGVRRPTYVTNVRNGRPAMRSDFPGQEGSLEFPGSASASSWTVYVALDVKQVDIASNQWVLRNNGGLGDLTLFLDSNVGGTDQVGYYDGTGDKNLANNLTGWQILSWHLHGSSGTGTVRRNGVVIGTSTFPLGGMAVNDLSILGSAPPSGANTEVAADVGEVAIYQGEHSQADIDFVLAYLNAGWTIY